MSLSSQSKANSPNGFISNQGDSLASATFFHLYLSGSEIKAEVLFKTPKPILYCFLHAFPLCLCLLVVNSGQAPCLQPGLAFRLTDGLT